MYALGYLGISILVQTTVKWYQYFYTPPPNNQGGLKILVPLGLIGFSMMQGITQVLGIMVAEAGSGMLINISSYRTMGIIDRRKS